MGRSATGILFYGIDLTHDFLSTNLFIDNEFDEAWNLEEWLIEYGANAGGYIPAEFIIHGSYEDPAVALAMPGTITRAHAYDPKSIMNLELDQNEINKFKYFITNNNLTNYKIAWQLCTVYG